MTRSTAFSRRDALALAGASVGAAVLPACAADERRSGHFAWGVASGDPTPTSVLLWTRLEVTRPEEVIVELFLDPHERRRVAREFGVAEPERDGTVKIDVEGLEPGTTYYYRFSTGRDRSALGRTRTLPIGPVERVRLAAVTCSNFGHGAFHAYRRIAERADLAVVVHLGDSIYEYAEGVYGAARWLDPPHECVTLSDYRRRYAHYRTDPDFREALRQHPFVVLWDDHEFSNNAHREGAPGHNPHVHGPWSDRVAAAKRAFFEWNPVREESRVHRELSVGDLARLLMLDTRIDGRDPPPVDSTDLERTDRLLVSYAQERWLLDRLHRADVVYTVIGNQVVLAPFSALGNLDAWDGFPAQRRRVLEAMARAPSLPVVLTGDTHASLAFDLPGPRYDPTTGAGSIGVEWGAPALCSPHHEGEIARAVERSLLSGTAHLRFTEQESKGYVLVEIDRIRARAEWWIVEDVARPDGGRERMIAAFEARPDDRASRRGSPTPLAPLSDAPALAPAEAESS